jgi:hypothetical protein
MAGARTFFSLISCTGNVNELTKNGLHATPYMYNDISPGLILSDPVFYGIHRYCYLNFIFETPKFSNDSVSV